jgi:hypothetical protein
VGGTAQRWAAQCSVQRQAETEKIKNFQLKISKNAMQCLSAVSHD